MCQTRHSLFNVNSFAMHPGLITGLMGLVMIVDSAPRYENLIAKHRLHHVAAQLCKSPLSTINNIISDVLCLKMKLLPV